MLNIRKTDDDDDDLKCGVCPQTDHNSIGKAEQPKKNPRPITVSTCKGFECICVSWWEVAKQYGYGDQMGH